MGWLASAIPTSPLTTNPVEAPLTRIDIASTEATGVEQPSRIMVDKITTMPKDKVRDHLGRLSDADLVRLDRALLVYLGLAD